MPGRIRIREKRGPTGEGEEQIGYAREFIRLLRKHRDSIKKFFLAAHFFEPQERTLRAYAQAHQEGVFGKETMIRNAGDMKVQLYYVSDHTTAYKVEIDGQQFFVKIQKRDTANRLTPITGFTEFLSSHRAQERLHGRPGVEVIDFQLGYKSKDTDVFVSKFVDLRKTDRLDFVLNALHRSVVQNFPLDSKDTSSVKYQQWLADKTLYDSLKDAIKEILSIVGQEYNRTDWDAYNFFYDPVRNVIICFDLHSTLLTLKHRFDQSKPLTQDQQDIKRRLELIEEYKRKQQDTKD